MRDAKSPSLKIYLDRNIFDKLQYLSLMRNCYSDEAENKLGCTGSITLSVQQDRAIYELTTLHDATVRFD
ncbi:hypothetical protein EV560_10185 [Bosea sp. BK604]|nr:hypothetical protein EV560_10185 [Bosea sp. BK604]